MLNSPQLIPKTVPQRRGTAKGGREFFYVCVYMCVHAEHIAIVFTFRNVQ